MPTLMPIPALPRPGGAVSLCLRRCASFSVPVCTVGVHRCYPMFCGWPDRRSRSYVAGGCSVVSPEVASERDLRALAAIVSENRPDLPDGEGLPPSLLADLMGQVRCDGMAFVGFDGGRQADWFAQEIPPTDIAGWEDLDRAYWTHYPDSKFCSYPGRTGDLRSIIK